MFAICDKLPTDLLNIVIEYIPPLVKRFAEGASSPTQLYLSAKEMKTLIDFGFYYEVEKYLFLTQHQYHGEIFRCAVYHGDTAQLDVIFRLMKQPEYHQFGESHRDFIHKNLFESIGDDMINVLEWAWDRKLIQLSDEYGPFIYAVISPNKNIIKMLNWLRDRGFVYNEFVFTSAAFSKNESVIEVLTWLFEHKCEYNDWVFYSTPPRVREWLNAHHKTKLYQVAPNHILANKIDIVRSSSRRMDMLGAKLFNTYDSMY